ncbi:MAG: hypothetical protein NTZ73_04005 [Candidatus Diapherotrites archaeon]|nr:hypothetical protein [Candidatus Diapherotrites archaeon]
MLEVVVLVVFVILLIILWVYFVVSAGNFAVAELEKNISLTKSRLRIAEKKFLQRKISKGVFNSLVEGFESDLVSYELGRAVLNRPVAPSVQKKAEEILARIPKPPKRTKIKITAMLKETEVLRREMSMLESKLLKHEIREEVFERLMTSKEKELIKKEADLLRLVEESHRGRLFEELQANETEVEK